MQVTVLLFASYRQEVGAREVILELPEGVTVREAAAGLEVQHEGLSLKGALCAVNEEYVSPERVLIEGERLAFFPPVAGGAPEEAQDYFFITHEVLRLEHYWSLVAGDAYGANAAFLGTVRSPNAGETVLRIDYEGYEAMMRTQMAAVVAELRQKYALGKVVIAHRLGSLLPGEASLALFVSSAHRREALESCAEGLERLKERLPVWKHEVTAEGPHWVAGSARAAETL